MDLRKLKTLIDLVSESNVSELEITEAEGKVRIVKAPAYGPATAVAYAPAPAAVAAAPVALAPAAVPAAPAAPAAAEKKAAEPAPAAPAAAAAAPAGDEPGAFHDSLPNVAPYALVVRAGDNRAEVHAGCEAVAGYNLIA